MKTLCTVFLLFLFASSAYSQTASDTIFKRNKEVLLVKILEIGLDEVKYKPVVNPNDIVLVIEKSQISKIVFSTGVVQTFTDPMKDKADYADNHRNNFKFNFLSPIGDRIHINWERSLRPGLSYELGLNLIGVGRRFGQYTPVGATVNGGIRMYRMPDMKSRSDRYSHLLNGSYFQPSLVVGMTQHNYREYDYSNFSNYDYTIKTANTGYLMFFLNLGKQYIFANRISFDFSAGLGYGTYTGQTHIFEDYWGYEGGYSRNPFNEYGSSRFGFSISGKEVPIAFNCQFKLGYLFR